MKKLKLDLKSIVDEVEVSDGYHTFDELYDHELAFGGSWFVLGIGKEKGKQITYHLPLERWDETNFAYTLEKAPEWDGHTSDDVLERLKAL